jgi:aminopeptidase-like protein
VRALPPGRYKVDIDTEHFDGSLRIGEYYLPGETDEEIMLTSYLCHPMGANDNVSGVVLSVELFRLLAQLPRRRYSYRLGIWPETIGSITYIHSYPDRIAKLKGGYVITCAGDGGKFTYKRSHAGDSLFDRAALHALTHSGMPFEAVPYRHDYGSDECQLNAVGLRLPFGSIMRTMYGFFPEYHSSADDLTVVTPEFLFETLKVYWSALMTLERAVTYKGSFKVDPFLTGHGIFPWDEGAGASGIGTAIARAYYHLMGGVDGRTDLLQIADNAGENIMVFDRAVNDFLRTELMVDVGKGSRP